MELRSVLGLPKSIPYFTRTIKFKVAAVSVKMSLELLETETVPIKSLLTPSLENGLPIQLANDQTINLKIFIGTIKKLLSPQNNRLFRVLHSSHSLPKYILTEIGSILNSFLEAGVISRASSFVFLMDFVILEN